MVKTILFLLPFIKTSGDDKVGNQYNQNHYDGKISSSNNTTADFDGSTITSGSGGDSAYETNSESYQNSGEDPVNNSSTLPALTSATR